MTVRIKGCQIANNEDEYANKRNHSALEMMCIFVVAFYHTGVFTMATLSEHCWPHTMSELDATTLRLHEVLTE